MTKRTCGGCTLCCRLLPTEEIASPANTKCPHQCSKGCRIYEQRPLSCKLWLCRWLAAEDTDDQLRPDRSHIVLDVMPDIIKQTDNETGAVQTVPVIVAWVDPDHPEAWKAPAFLRYVKRQTMPVLIRYGSTEGGGVLYPPAMTGLAEVAWHESSYHASMPTTLAEKARALGAQLDTGDGTLLQPEQATMRMPDGRTITVAAGWRAV